MSDLDRARADFRVFLFILWKRLGLPEPTPVQYALASYLQFGPAKRIIEAFRGVGKSWITAAYCVWRLWSNPQLKILIFSAGESLANDQSAFILKIIRELPFLKHLEPPHDHQSKVSFDVGPARPSKDRSVSSVSIFGNIQGKRADLILGDDVESKRNSETPGKRAKLYETTAELDAILKPGGDLIYLGTPQVEESLYSRLYDLLTDDGQRIYDCRIWPAEKPDAQTATWYGDRLAPYVRDLDIPVGTTVEPLRFTDEILEGNRIRYGRSGYRLQYMLCTDITDAERFPLRVRDLIVMPLDIQQGPTDLVWGPTPVNEKTDLRCLARDGDSLHGPAEMREGHAFLPYSVTIMSIDPSGRGKDETSAFVLRALHGRIFVADVVALSNAYDENNLEQLAQVAKTYAVQKVVYESNFGDEMFQKVAAEVFNRVHPVSFEGVRATTQKERRIIAALSPVMMSHRLVIDSEVIRKDYELSHQKYDVVEYLSRCLVFQLARITEDRGCLDFDDRVDALAQGVKFLEDHAAIDRDRAARDAADALIDERLRQRDARLGIPQPSASSYSISEAEGLDWR